MTSHAGLGTPAQQTSEYPASIAQRALWFLSELEPESAAYNVAWVTFIDGALDAGILEHALGELVHRHDALRTTFRLCNGQPVQRVAPSLTLRLPVLDLHGVPAQDGERTALELAEREGWRPFHLADGPLFRARLLRLEDRRHMLLLACHHIIFDAWSLGILTRDLWVLYRAALEGTPPPLPPLAARYGDFAARQHERLQGTLLEGLVDYWREQLAGAPPFLDLPTDRPRPGFRSYRGASQSLVLPPELSTAVGAWSRRELATPFMTLFAAFQVLLARYTRQTDLVVGTPIAGRLHSEFEGLIGYFVNMLPLRTRIPGHLPFRELLRRVRETALAAYDHQELPFERLVDRLQPPRSVNRTPVFQVTFAMQNVPELPVEVPGLTLRTESLQRTTAKFDLSLSLFPERTGFRAVMDYSTDLFEPATTARMLEHYRALLEAVIASPDSRIDSLPLLTHPERRRLLDVWSAGAAQRVPDCGMHQLFEAQVDRTPDAVAVAAGNVEITYRELDRRANQVAWALHRLGVGTDDVVAIFLDRSIDMVASVFGVLKAGAAYLPLDPLNPPERLAVMLVDARPAAVLSRARLLPQLPDHRIPVLDVDASGSELARERLERPQRRVHPENLAYVIYTSGSTGRPKGAAVVHRGVVNVYHALAPLIRLRPGDRVLQFSSLAFDLSMTELLMALCSGATLCLGAREALTPGEPLARFLGEQRINALWLTPSSLAAMPRSPLPALRVLALGGEPLPAELARHWSVGRLVLNLYGPTETTMFSTLQPVAPDGLAGRIVSIGRPIANTQVYVLDSRLEPVPIGVTGEMYLGGAGVGRGYVGRPGLTAERFIPNPFGNAAGSRLYRTGDLARWRGDGSIEILGRVDLQVKVRGFRIELEEIEAILSRHPAVRECAVAAREADGGGKQLVAYVAPVPGTELRGGELRSLAASALPEYMVPRVKILPAGLPRTVGGKVDRAGLAALADTDPEPAEPPALPRTPMEEQVAAVWRELLGTAQFGVHDDFFELGGHSLMATQVVARLRDRFQIQLPLIALFETPTIAELAARIPQGRKSGAAQPATRGADAQIA